MAASRYSYLGSLNRGPLRRSKNHVLSVFELEKILYTGKTIRNNADEVWPKLYLGNQEIAANKGELYQMRITHILNAAHSRWRGKILVHCAVGVSRSATLVLAYLMIYQRMTLVEAINTVKDKRGIIPNRGFLRQLLELESTLRRNH
uniref:Dual specificity protein phosphatase 26 n=1 Tax=Pyxicephalus adspersus TaxID=30357 RepID=A0AAV3AVT7_PYXAD|nr:TPA: hypothetical protein GDO54_007787 [Pyxicephalus adspersus]